MYTPFAKTCRKSTGCILTARNHWKKKIALANDSKTRRASVQVDDRTTITDGRLVDNLNRLYRIKVEESRKQRIEEGWTTVEDDGRKEMVEGRKLYYKKSRSVKMEILNAA